MQRTLSRFFGRLAVPPIGRRIPPQLRCLTLALAGAALATSPASAQATAAACGGDVACAVEGGVYHIERPQSAAPPAGSPDASQAVAQNTFKTTLPVVLFLHGWGGSGVGQMKNRALVDGLRERGYAVIAPTGQPRGQGRSGSRWNAFARDDLRDDVAFLQRVADDAAARFDLDRDQMLLAGFSGGGMMAWRVACDAPQSFAAYAPIAGLLWRPLPDACAGPVKLLHTHGWSDTVVPIEGRSVAGGRITQGDLFVGLDMLRRANGCRRDDPDGYATDGGLWRRVWTDCAPGSALEFALHAGGHQTPKGWTAMAIDWFETELNGAP